MGIFEPLIEHSDGKPPEHPLDVVAPILVLLLAAVCEVDPPPQYH